jgi:TRAP-type transport system periplasmic protein
MAWINVKFGGYQEPASIHNQAASFFGSRLRERLGSDVGFELIGSVLKLGRNSGDLPLMVESGELTFCYLATIRFVEWVPEFRLFDLPFVVQDRVRTHRALAGALGDRFKAQMDRASPYKLLGMWDNGFRHLSNRVRSVRTPADCQGLRVRIQMSALIAETLAAMGCIPIAEDIKRFLGEIGGARFDGQENPLTNIYNFGVHRHHRYVTLTGHIYGASAMLCSAQQYRTWPAEVRAAVDESAREATAHQHKLAAAEDDAIMAKIDPQENEIIRLTSAEHARFVEATRPVVEKHRGSLDPQLFEYLR